MDSGFGIYFRREDYASFWRRLLVDVIDAMVVVIICGLLLAAMSAFLSANLIFLVCGPIFFCYFVLLKRSKSGTLGYRLGGVRIVGLDGRRAGIGPLTIRMLFMFIGPTNYIWDIAWMAMDPQRQALRDKAADTYVVRRRAEPIGTGKLFRHYYWILGYCILFREIEVNQAR
jgi:uncharacterized RDD family membrane protein YckC